MKFSPDLGDHSVVWKSVLKLAGHDADNSEYLKWVFEIRGTPEAPQRHPRGTPEAQEHELEFDILGAANE